MGTFSGAPVSVRLNAILALAVLARSGAAIGSLVVFNVSGAALAEPAHRHHRTGFSPLTIDGYALRWRSRSAGGTVRLSWSYALDRHETPKAVNCKSMSSLAPIAGQLGGAVLRRETEAAFAAWQAVANVEFTYTADWKAADILIGAQTRPHGAAFANVDYVADNGTQQARIRKGLVCLNPLRLWKNGFDGNLEVLDIRYVLMHEIGHTLGLDHAGRTGQLMSFRYDERYRTLQPGDVAGITALYGARRVAVSKR